MTLSPHAPLFRCFVRCRFGWCQQPEKNARAVVWDEALADGPGIVALRYGASNVVGWVGQMVLGGEVGG